MGSPPILSSFLSFFWTADLAHWPWKHGLNQGGKLTMMSHIHSVCVDIFAIITTITQRADVCECVSAHA